MGKKRLRLFIRIGSPCVNVEVRKMSGEIAHEGQWSVFSKVDELLTVFEEHPWWKTPSKAVLVRSGDLGGAVPRESEFRMVLGTSSSTLQMTVLVQPVSLQTSLADLYSSVGCSQSTARAWASHLSLNDVKDLEKLAQCVFTRLNNGVAPTESYVR